MHVHVCMTPWLNGSLEFEKEFKAPKRYKAKRRFKRPIGNAETRQRQCAESDDVVFGATAWLAPVLLKTYA